MDKLKNNFIKIVIIIITILFICIVGCLFFIKENTLEFEVGEILKVAELSDNNINNKTVSLIAVGDIMMSRDVDSTMKRRGSYNYPFEKTKNYLQQADIVFGNLEAPITPGRTIVTEEMVFRTDPETAPALKDAGFNVVSLANNHIMNFGMSGLDDTKKYLDEQEISYAQDKEYTVIEKNGLHFVFLVYAYNFGLNTEKMTWQIQEQKLKNDFVIVSMHAGAEYVQYPNTEQKDFAHAAIDAGADLVLGHHPHVTQIVEKYNGKYIFYSLGNFVFDQMWSEETKKGLVTKFIFNEDGIEEIELEDVYIIDFAQPNFSDQSDSVYNRLEIGLSEKESYTYNPDLDVSEKFMRKYINIDKE